MFFGSDGSSFHQFGNMTYQSGKNKNKSLFENGNASFRSDGVSFFQNGNTSYGSNGKSINKFGNTYYCSNGTSYNLIGNVLHSSKGKSFFGVNSDADARRIIEMDM